jgi:hypothetical protein
VGESADKILEDELAKLGAAGGAVGAAIGSAVTRMTSDSPVIGSGAAAGAAGGAAGARFGARFQKDTSETATVELDASPEDALRRLVKAFDNLGELHPSESDAPGARAVIRSGFLSMNPAVVDATVEPAGEGHTTINLRASAKEGLINQDTAEKALAKVAEALDAKAD